MAEMQVEPTHYSPKIEERMLRLECLRTALAAGGGHPTNETWPYIRAFASTIYAAINQPRFVFTVEKGDAVPDQAH